ncbi:SGNH hydrolase domain-containing protein, partial [Dokdonia ponticola]
EEGDDPSPDGESPSSEIVQGGEEDGGDGDGGEDEATNVAAGPGATWLTRLEDAMAGDQVLSLPYGDPDAERSIALIGGSHAEHWLPALHVLPRDHPFRIEVFVKVGCPAKLPIGDDGWVGECEEWTLNVLAALDAARKRTLLEAMADAIEAAAPDILDANARDLAAAVAQRGPDDRHAGRDPRPGREQQQVGKSGAKRA